MGSFAGDVLVGLKDGILLKLSRVGTLLRLSPRRWARNSSFCLRRPESPLPPKALPWIWVLSGRPAARGRSSGWTAAGSYSCFCSRANMLLFLTRDAFFRFSMEERLGESGLGEGSLGYSFSEPKRALGDVVCSFQNRRGLLSNGDEPKGDVSLVNIIFCATLAVAYRGNEERRKNAKCEPGNTFVLWLKLGEFLLCSVGPISESGRENTPPLFGEPFGVLLMRSGDTLQHASACNGYAIAPGKGVKEQ